MPALFKPSTIVPLAILASVAAMVVSANLREGRPVGRLSPAVPALGEPGAPATTRDGLTRRVAEMEARLAERPDDVDAAVALADVWLRLTRVTGDAGLALRAEAVLEDARRTEPANYSVGRMFGPVYLSQHRFSDALAAAAAARDMRPLDPFNYGVSGDAHLELGDYDAAFDDFDRMMALRPGAPSYARVAYARQLQGNLTGALEAMQLAAEAAVGGDVEAMAWYRAQVGELYLELGRPHDAAEQFARASQAFPGHPLAVAGYARTREMLGDIAGARTLLDELVRRAPTPDLLARLGDLLAASGRLDEAGRHYALAEAFWRSDMPEPANLARFLADQGLKLDEAVAIAEAAVAARRDIFTVDALAWAYFKAGRIADAKRTLPLALRTGTRDRVILAHAEAIRAAGAAVGAR